MEVELVFFVVGAMLGAVLWDLYIRISESGSRDEDDREQ